MHILDVSLLFNTRCVRVIAGEVQLEAPWNQDHVLLRFVPQAWDISFMEQVKIIHYSGAGAAPGDSVPIQVTLQVDANPLKMLSKTYN